MLQWLRTQDPPCPWNAGVYIAAQDNGHYNALEWLDSQNAQSMWLDGGAFEEEDWLV